jgi:hypothetical protein
MKRFLLLLLVMCPFTAFAQNSSVGGVVLDPSGAVVPKASVEFRNQDTGIRRQTESNGSGHYQLEGIDPGRYDATVQASGFKTITREAVVFHVGDRLQIDFKMQLGESTEHVEVDGSGLQLNTSDASVSTVIDRKFVANMPLNGRSFQDLISLTPGVVTQSPQTANQAIGTTGDFSINGQRTQSNYYTVDGVTANTSGGNGGGVGEAATGGTVSASTALGTTQSLISVDALQEFRIESSSYSAEYGRSPGGQFSLVTRSGTNIPHGTVYDYLRNNYFDANDWFNDYYRRAATALRQNDFGGTLGGPVFLPKLYNGKDRTFFFVSYEGLRLTQPTPSAIQYVPDLFMRQQATAAMKPILNAFPLPNGIDYGSSSSPNFAQFIAPYSLPSSIDSTSVRLDHTLNSKVSIFFRFGDTPSSTESRPYFARTTTTSNAQTYTLGTTAQLSSKITNDFRLGYARANSSQIGVLDNFGGATPINLTNAIGGGAVPSIEPVILLYFPAIGESLLTTYYGLNLSRQWNLVDSTSLLVGHHNLKFGVDFRHIKSPVTPSNVEPYAEFLTPAQVLSGTTYLTEFINRKVATPLFNETAVFGQDEWRLHPRITISMGLRWEVDPPPTEQHGDDAFTLSGSLGNPSSLSVAPQGTPLWKTPWLNFAPRLGVAWKAHSQPGLETVVRGGGGVFFDTSNEVAAMGYSGLGFDAYQIAYGATIPFTQNQLTTPISTAAPYTGVTIYAFPSHLQLPYTLEWNASLQQALGRSQAITVSYVGANGRRLTGLQESSLSKLNPNFGIVEYFAGGLTSNYQGLQLQFQRSVAHGLQALASYTWSHSIDFGSNSSALPLQRANSDFDVRNNLQAGLTWDLPAVHTSKPFSFVLNDWGLDARLNARTAFPVTLGGNLTLDPATGSYYPGGLNLIANVPIYLFGANYPGRKIINKAAFTVPASGASGSAPRNFIRGFGATQVNTAVRREFHIYNAVALQFRAEAFNILNHPNFGYVDPTFSDATFGQATKMLNTSLGTVASQYQQGGPRSMQFALKLVF